MNGRLFDELDYCVPLGIPHSTFLAWDPLDQDKALAYKAEMRKVCSGCHTRREEWADNPDAYVGDIDFCPGCERLAAEEDNMPEERERRRGMRPRLVTQEYAVTQAARLADVDVPSDPELIGVG